MAELYLGREMRCIFILVAVLYTASAHALPFTAVQTRAESNLGLDDFQEQIDPFKFRFTSLRAPAPWASELLLIGSFSDLDLDGNHNETETLLFTIDGTHTGLDTSGTVSITSVNPTSFDATGSFELAVPFSRFGGFTGPKLNIILTENGDVDEGFIVGSLTLKIRYDVAPVPLPTSGLLLSSVFAGLLARRILRNRLRGFKFA
ncbi:MAG: hypothetical protein AAGF94_01580 [Pseudomonadota bacterium]